jgi:ribosomal protein S18 acetylase RimI-like enzyme
MRSSGETFFVFFRRHKPIGVISTRQDGDLVEICRLVVHPRHQREGIASRLLEHVAARAAGGARLLSVSTSAKNLPALALYGRHGYRERRRRTTKDGLELVTLDRAIDRELDGGP